MDRSMYIRNLPVTLHRHLEECQTSMQELDPGFHVSMNGVILSAIRLGVIVLQDQTNRRLKDRRDFEKNNGGE